MFLSYIDPLVFFIALGIGIFIAYVINPAPKLVYKYPTVDNSEKTTYLDDEGVCYKYKAEEIPQPVNDNIDVFEIE